MEPKIDGVAVCLRYEHGQLVSGATCGAWTPGARFVGESREGLRVDGDIVSFGAAAPLAQALPGFEP